MENLKGGGDADGRFNISCRDQPEVAKAPCKGCLSQHWGQGRCALETATGGGGNIDQAGKDTEQLQEHIAMQVQDAANHLHMASESLQPQQQGEERTFSSAAEVTSYSKLTLTLAYVTR